MSAAAAPLPVPPPLRRLRRNERLPASFGLSLAMHLLLFAALAVAVRWNVEPQGAAVVELWGPIAGAEKPAAAPQPEVAEPPPQPAPPPVQAQPEPVRPEVDIALEQEKKRRAAEAAEAEARRQAELKKKAEEQARQKEEERKKAEADAAQKRAAAEAEKKRMAAAQREQDQRLAAQSVELRKQIEARAQAQAGGSGAPGAVASVGRGSADAGYAAQVISCIRPHIVYAVPENIKPGQYRAEFVVHLLPSGEQVGSPRLDKPSGLSGFDGAVERAIRRCDPFPRKKDGTVDRTVTVIVDPVDAR